MDFGELTGRVPQGGLAGRWGLALVDAALGGVAKRISLSRTWQGPHRHRRLRLVDCDQLTRLDLRLLEAASS